MKCLCGETKSTHLFSSGLYDIVRCSACGQVRTQARGKPKRTGYYEKEDVTVYIERQQMFRALFVKLLRFIHRYAPGGTLVDIGAGVGLLLDEARKIGYEIIGLEPSKASVNAARKYFGIRLIAQEFAPGIVKKPVDVIVINHVLEHLKHPKDIINRCAESLKARGVLVIGVPNFNSFMCRIKRGKWQSLIPAQHRWQFTLETLDRLVLPHRFRRIAVSYDNHDRSMHYWWKKPIYWILDIVALMTGKAEAMVVIYQCSR